MSFLYLLEDIRNPVLDAFFSFVTHFGEETLFMLIGMILFWCVDKFQGYYLLCIGFLGTVVNRLLKMLFRVPRPWVADPNFTVVESAKAEAGGYSFPSGHTQTSVGLFGGIARWNKGTAWRIVGIALCILVPFSRMYLGVHTPTDVGASIAVALLMVFVLYPLFQKGKESPKIIYIMISVMVLLAAGYLCFMYGYKFPASAYSNGVVEGLATATENGWKMLGCLVGMLAVYTVDQKWTHFETDALWWVQILKVVLGVGLVFALKEGLRAPMEALFDGKLLGDGVRYFIMVLVGGAIYPISFKCFSKIGRGKKDEV